MDDMKGILGDDKFEILHAFNHYFIVWDIFSINLKTEAISYLLQGKNPFPHIKDKMRRELDEKGEHDYVLSHKAFMLFNLKISMKFENLVSRYNELKKGGFDTPEKTFEWEVHVAINQILELLYSFEDGTRKINFLGDTRELAKRLQSYTKDLKNCVKYLEFHENERNKPS